MIKTVIFDMGGVVITLDENEAGKRFVELGMKEFAEKMDPYKQSGLNGDLEEGKLSEEEYQHMIVDAAEEYIQVGKSMEQAGLLVSGQRAIEDPSTLPRVATPENASWRSAQTCN